jgi:hypothetical protein
VRDFEDHPGCAKVRFLNSPELTYVSSGT